MGLASSLRSSTLAQNDHVSQQTAEMEEYRGALGSSGSRVWGGLGSRVQALGFEVRVWGGFRIGLEK